MERRRLIRLLSRNRTKQRDETSKTVSSKWMTGFVRISAEMSLAGAMNWLCHDAPG